LHEKTVTTTEIAKATGKDKSTILRRAVKENWEATIHEKGKRKKFVLDKLPEDIKASLSAYQENQTQKKKEISPEPIETKEEKAPGDNDIDTTPKEIPQDTIAEPPKALELSETKQKELAELICKVEKKSILLLGKNGIGKTYTLELLARNLSPKYKVIHFAETPTAKTILLNISIATGIKSGASKEDSFKNLGQYEGPVIILCIDQLENITPSSVAVLNKLFSFPWFRFIGAGHLGGKKKHNSTWMKAQAHFLKTTSRNESMKLIDQIWLDGDISHKKIIVDEARGIPGNIVRMAKEARQGIMPQEEQKYLDATPIILIIATIGLALRVIGYGYASTEKYIMGGVIGSIFWGLFWIYRGYIQGWWGSRKPKYSKK
jgi:energy-coupling factor transporter ATP-binding protein EcfA2